MSAFMMNLDQEVLINLSDMETSTDTSKMVNLSMMLSGNMLRNL